MLPRKKPSQIKGKIWRYHLLHTLQGAAGGITSTRSSSGRLPDCSSWFATHTGPVPAGNPDSPKTCPSSLRTLTGLSGRAAHKWYDCWRLACFPLVPLPARQVSTSRRLGYEHPELTFSKLCQRRFLKRQSTSSPTLVGCSHGSADASPFLFGDTRCGGMGAVPSGRA